MSTPPPPLVVMEMALSFVSESEGTHADHSRERGLHPSSFEHGGSHSASRSSSIRNFRPSVHSTRKNKNHKKQVCSTVVEQGEEVGRAPQSAPQPATRKKRTVQISPYATNTFYGWKCCEEQFHPVIRPVRISTNNVRLPSVLTGLTYSRKTTSNRTNLPIERERRALIRRKKIDRRLAEEARHLLERKKKQKQEKEDRKTLRQELKASRALEHRRRKHGKQDQRVSCSSRQIVVRREYGPDPDTILQPRRPPAKWFPRGPPVNWHGVYHPYAFYYRKPQLECWAELCAPDREGFFVVDRDRFRMQRTLAAIWEGVVWEDEYGIYTIPTPVRLELPKIASFAHLRGDVQRQSATGPEFEFFDGFRPMYVALSSAVHAGLFGDTFKGGFKRADLYAMLSLTYRILRIRDGSDFVMLVNDVLHDSPAAARHINRTMGKLLDDMNRYILRETQDVQRQSGVDEFMDNLENDGNTQFELLSNTTATVSAIINSPLGQKFLDLCGMLVALGFIQRKHLELSFNDVKIFCVPEKGPKEATVLTAIDAFFKVIERAVRVASQCFQERSLLPLGYDNMRMRNFERAYLELKGYEPALLPGNLELLRGITMREYHKMALAAIELGQKCILGKLSAIARGVLERKINDLQKLALKCEIQIALELGKVDPYVFNLFGDSGVGKSEIMGELVKLILENALGEYSPSMVATISEEMSHDNTAKTNVKAYIADDLGNLTERARTVAPAATLLKYTGMQMRLANMAALEDKGTTLLNHILFAISANTLTFGAKLDSVNSGAIERRVANVFKVKALPFLTNNSTALDRDRIAMWKPFFDFGSMGPVNVFEIQKTYVVKGTKAERRTVRVRAEEYPLTVAQMREQNARAEKYVEVASQLWTLTPEDRNAVHQLFNFPDASGYVTLSCVDYKTLQAYVFEDTTRYYAIQKDRMESKAKVNAGPVFCPDCNSPGLECSCVQLEKETADEERQIGVPDSGEEPDFGDGDPVELESECYLSDGDSVGEELLAHMEELDRLQDSLELEEPFQFSPFPEHWYFEPFPDEETSPAFPVAYALWRRARNRFDGLKDQYVNFIRDTVQTMHRRVPETEYEKFLLDAYHADVVWDWRTCGRLMRSCFSNSIQSNVVRASAQRAFTAWKYREMTAFAGLLTTPFLTLMHLSGFSVLLSLPAALLIYYWFLRQILFQAREEVAERLVAARMRVMDDNVLATRVFDFAASASVIAFVYLIGRKLVGTKKTAERQSVPRVPEPAEMVNSPSFSYHKEENVPTVPHPALEGMQPEILAGKVAQNMELVYFHYGPENGHVPLPQKIHVLGLSAHYFVTLKHPFEQRKVVGVSRAREGPQAVVRSFDVRQLYLFPGRDLAVFRCAHFGSKEEIRHLFPESEFKSGPLQIVSTRDMIHGSILSYDEPYLPRATGRTPSSFPRGYFDQRTSPFRKLGSCVVRAEEKVFQFGDCGSAYISLSGKRRGIIGLHVAAIVEKEGKTGSPGKERCIFEPLSVELISQGVRSLPTQSFEMTPVPPVERQMEEAVPEMGITFGVNPGVHSPTYHLPPEAYVRVIGKCRKGRSLSSKVCPTYGASLVRREFGVTQEYGPPPMKRKEDGTLNYPYYVAMLQTSQASLTYAPNIKDIIDSYLKPIRPELSLVEQGPLSPEELLWGTGDGRLGSLKLSTSSGFGHRSPKREHFYECEGRWYPTQPLWDEFNRLDARVRKGERMIHYWQATVKDEPVKLGRDKKARVFMCPQMLYTMLMRKYFGRLLQFVYKRSELTMFAYGENAVSPEWHSLLDPIRRMKYHGELDYKKFDQSTTSSSKSVVAGVVMDMIRAFGTYGEADLTACNTLLAEYVEMMIAYDGSLVLMPSGTPSGLLLTTLVNCIDNVLRMASAYYLITGSHNMRGAMELRVHGDDVVYGTNDSSLTFGAFRDALLKLGTVVTPPGDNKDMENPPPFVPFERMTFLSRQSVYHDRLGCYVGALQLTSLFKGLLVRVKGNNLTHVEHFISAAQSFLYEAFAHGPEKYAEFRSKIAVVLSELGLLYAVPQCQMSYEERAQEILRSSNLTLIQQELGDFSVNIEEIYDHSDITGEWDDILPVRDCPRAGTGIEPDCPVGEIRRESAMSDAFSDVSTLTTTHTNKPTAEGDGLTTWFIGENTENSVEIANFNDVTRRATETGDERLSDILNRQILLTRLQWTPATAFQTIDVWRDVFNDTFVREKLSGFSLFNGTIRLKFIVNGTKFFSGRATVSYFPRPNPELPYHEDFATDDQTLCLQSQMMHLHIDPSMSSAGEMVLPFMFDQASLEMRRGNYSSLGLVHFNPVIPISTVLSGNPTVGISVYAKFETINLSVPTDLEIARQSEIDETKVSQRIQSVANYASLYESVPYIGPYAKATEMIGSTAAGILSAFGFSKPHSMQTPGKYLKSYGESMSSAHNEVNHTTLAYNPKAEVTVDPRVTGVNVGDELSIASIAGRDSHFSQFTWTQLQNAGEALARYQVSPMLCPTAQNAPFGQRLALTSCAFVSNLFTYWRGTIKFRFQIVGPQMVNGRLRIVHHPTACGNDPPYNVLRSVLVDLSETRDVEFCIPWAKGEEFLEVGTFQNIHPNASIFSSNSNGQIGVFIENELVGPDEEIPQINILVSMSAEELQLFEPTENGFRGFDVRSVRAPAVTAFPGNANTDSFISFPVDDLVGAIRNAGGTDDTIIPLQTPVANGPPADTGPDVLWVTGIDGDDPTFRDYDGPTVAWGAGFVTALLHAPLPGTSEFVRLTSTRDRAIQYEIDGQQLTTPVLSQPRRVTFPERATGSVTFRIDATGGNNNLVHNDVDFSFDDPDVEMVTLREEQLEQLGLQRGGGGWRLPRNFEIPENAGASIFTFTETGSAVEPSGQNVPRVITGLSYVAYSAGVPLPDLQRQAGEAEQEATEEPTHSCDMQANPIPVHLHTIFHDDPLVSLRTMLKREYPTGSIYLAPGQNDDIRPMYPLFRLRGDDNLPTKVNLFSYITMPFAAMRGSMRWTLIPVSGTARTITLTRGEAGTRRESPDTVSGNAGSISGSDVFPFDSSARVTIPYYFPVRFLRPITFPTSHPTTKFSVRTTVSSRDVGAIDLYTSIGEDFALVNWRGAPFLYT
mgnify:FL=1